MGFWSKFVLTKLKDLKYWCLGLVARLDKNGYATAAIAAKEDELSEIAEELAERQAYLEEQRKLYLGVKESYNLRLSAAKRLSEDDGNVEMEKLLCTLTTYREAVAREGKKLNFWVKHTEKFEKYFKDKLRELEDVKNGIEAAHAELSEASLRKDEAIARKDAIMGKTVDPVEDILSVITEETSRATIAANAANLVSDSLGDDAGYELVIEPVEEKQPLRLEDFKEL